MRALTPNLTIPVEWTLMERRNEVLAREGIDTLQNTSGCSLSILSRNEVLAREGIDTKFFLRISH